MDTVTRFTTLESKNLIHMQPRPNLTKITKAHKESGLILIRLKFMVTMAGQPPKREKTVFATTTVLHWHWL